MAEQSYYLEFGGYWRVPNKSGLPAKSGIYCVYACTYNKQTDKVTLLRVLYIGESDNVKDRVSGHERWGDWEAELNWGEVLCFTAALISPDGARQRAEAAMIYKHEPPCNEEHVHLFPFETTTVSTSGKVALLHERFTVYRSY